MERASIPQLLMPLVCSVDVQNILKFACTLCSGALLQQLWLGWGMGRCSPYAFFWYCLSRASMGLSKHRTPSDCSFPDLQRACAKGGGYSSCDLHRLPHTGHIQ